MSVWAILAIVVLIAVVVVVAGPAVKSVLRERPSVAALATATTTSQAGDAEIGGAISATSTASAYPVPATETTVPTVVPATLVPAATPALTATAVPPTTTVVPSVFDTSKYDALVAHFTPMQFVENGLNWLDFLNQSHPGQQWGTWLTPNFNVPAGTIVWLNFHTMPVPAGVEEIKVTDNLEGSRWGIFAVRVGFTTDNSITGGSWVDAKWLVERFTAETLAAAPVPETLDAFTPAIAAGDAATVSCPSMAGMTPGEAVDTFLVLLGQIGTDSPLEFHWAPNDKITLVAGWLIGADIFLNNIDADGLETISADGGWGVFLTTSAVTLEAPINGGNAVFVGTSCDPNQ